MPLHAVFIQDPLSLKEVLELYQKIGCSWNSIKSELTGWLGDTDQTSFF